MVPGFLSELECVDGEEDGCLREEGVGWNVGRRKVATVGKVELVIEWNKVEQPIAERELNSELADFRKMTRCLLARV